MAKENEVKRYRDAESGRYITRKYAEKNPKTTAKDRDKVPAKSSPKKK